MSTRKDKLFIFEKHSLENWKHFPFEIVVLKEQVSKQDLLSAPGVFQVADLQDEGLGTKFSHFFVQLDPLMGNPERALHIWLIEKTQEIK